MKEKIELLMIACNHDGNICTACHMNELKIQAKMIFDELENKAVGDLYEGRHFTPLQFKKVKKKWCGTETKSATPTSEQKR